MKITAIGHASLLVEARGTRIISDPWWRGPCFGAQWWNYPPPALSALADCRIDYIYISHGHHDHFHPGTLRTLNRDAKVLVSRHIDLATSIRELGFEVTEIDDDSEVELGSGIKCRVIRTYGLDTLMTISDGREVCINLNDALHSAPNEIQSAIVTRLRALYPEIDYVFCGYGVASHFPNCYEIPGKDREATAALRQKYFNGRWAKLIAELQPRFGFPFAADVIFLEDDLFWANEPTHNSERPTQLFHALYPRSKVKTLDVAPGFVIEDGKVMAMILREPIRAAALSTTCADSIERANRLGRVTEDDVRDVLALLQQNVNSSLEYLRSCESDYLFLVEFRNSPFGIGIGKHGQEVTLWLEDLGRTPHDGYDIVYTTRLPYLKWSFTIPFGDEILFVGSGGIFKYRRQADAKRNLHRELKFLLTKHEAPFPVRESRSNPLIRFAKDAVKRVIGRSTEDLYDLGNWTVFSDRSP